MAQTRLVHESYDPTYGSDTSRLFPAGGFEVPADPGSVGWRSTEKDSHFDFSSVELRSSHPTPKESQ